MFPIVSVLRSPDLKVIWKIISVVIVDFVTKHFLQIWPYLQLFYINYL